MRQHEHGVKVRDRQKFILPSLDPSLTGLGLALGAMAVTTAIEGDSQILAAVQALIDMTTASRRAAPRNGAHNLELLKLEPAPMALDKWPAQRAEDIGHLHGGPVHCFFFRPDRLTVSSVETGSASTGLVTECRCGVDRCKYREVVSKSECPSKS